MFLCLRLGKYLKERIRMMFILLPKRGIRARARSFLKREDCFMPPSEKGQVELT
jgi:hypothetical protein